MLPPIEPVSGAAPVSDTSCVERGVWSPIPVEPPGGPHHLKLKNVDANEAQAIRERGIISFHAVGCSGNFKDHLPGSMVAKAMAAQINNPRVYAGSQAAVGASFLFHLGDLVYKDEDQADPDGKDQATMYNSQFYVQFANYSREIFAIPGNHDGKTSVKKKKWGILHFLQNFCASKRQKSPDDQTNASNRLTMIQPYPYWLFETAVCYVVALYTNDINGGQLDDPMGTEKPQYQWLVDTLKSIKGAANGKAVFLALHYPRIPAPRILRNEATRTWVRRHGAHRRPENCFRWEIFCSRLFTKAVSTRMLFCRLTRTFISGSPTPTRADGKSHTWFAGAVVMVRSRRSPRHVRGRVSRSEASPSMRFSHWAWLSRKETR
jgi:hypothetical protein